MRIRSRGCSDNAGSFTAAARQLGLSKSAVAKSVGRLEDNFGVRLFSRNTRRFALTVEGQAFYERCVRALSELEAAEAALYSQRIEPNGRLRIDIPVVFGRRWILPILLNLGTRFPRLNMEISLTDRLVDPIEEGIDLVVRIGELKDSSVLIGRYLGTQTSVVCASPSYIAESGQPATLDDLADHSCIAFGRGGHSTTWAFNEGHRKLRTFNIHGRLMLNYHDAILDAALAGHGIALLATWLAKDHLDRGSLLRLLPDEKPVGFPIHVLWPQSHHLSVKVRTVVDELVRHFTPRPPWEGGVE